MVYKRSEYGHQFKVSSLVKNLPVYQEHLNYRHLRRERECAHTPLSWDVETIDTSESDEKLSQEGEVAKLPLTGLVIREEEEPKVETDDEKEECCNNDKSDDVLINEVEREKKTTKAKFADRQEETDLEILQQDDALRKSAKEKLKKYSSNINKDEPTKLKNIPEKKVLGKTFVTPKQADDKVFVKSVKPRRPDRVNKVPRSRPQSAPASRPASQQVAKSHPFYNYGCGDRERETGDKKTFNVRASSAVYPAALRAKKRNQLLIEKQLENQRTASAREKRRKAKFNEKIARDTASWESEYRRCFPAYDNTEYAISDKDPRKRKSVFIT